MQIFTTNYSTKAIRSLTGVLRNVKDLISFVNPGKQSDILPESRIYVPGKRTLSLLVLCMFMGFTGSILAQATFTVTPATKTATLSEVFNLTVVITTSEAANGGEVHMTFDENILQVNSITKTAPFDNLLIAPSFDNINGTIDFAAGIPNFGVVPFDGTFNFLIIEVQAIANGNSAVDFNGVNPSKITSGVNPGTVILDSATGAVINVGIVNEPPVFDNNISDQINIEQDIVTLDASATDPDGNTVIYQATNLPAGLVIDSNGLISGTIEVGAATAGSLNTGVYDVAVTATDDGIPILSNSQNFAWTVDTPTVTSYTVTATAGPNGTIDPFNATVNEGGSQFFAITPDTGYEVAEVLVDGIPVLPVPTASYTLMNVTEGADISVSFSEIATDPFQLCIASGSGDLTAFGRNFVGDSATTPPTGLGFARTNGLLYDGYTGPITNAIAGDETLLFQKEIYGGKIGANGTSPYTYDIPVTNGFYQVNLYFTEVFHTETNKRIFDVLLEGNVILDEYEMVDPIKDGISTFQTAITRTYYVNVTDGSLQVGIGPAAVDNGKLSGLCVTAVTSANLHPVTAIGDLTYDALVAVADPLNIVDPESDVLSVVFNGLPASLSYDPATNQIQGTPLATDANTYTINAIISDGTNSPVTEEFTLVINPVPGNDSPTIVDIDDAKIAEGTTLDLNIQVNDDTDTFASIEIYDKSVVHSANTDPYTSGGTVSGYTFTENPVGSGSYTLNWPTGLTDGRSYSALVTADDGVNQSVTTSFDINIAQDIPNQILGKTFSSPLPWYKYAAATPPPAPQFTVAIEVNASENAGYIDNGDFVEYVINVPNAGVYDLELFSGKGSNGTTVITFSEENGGGFVPIGSISVLKTGWQTYVSYKTQVNFTNAGVQTLRFDFNGGANIRDFNFTLNASPVFTAEITDQNNLEGDTPIGLAVAANDPDGGDSVTFSDNGTLPSGLSIDLNTGAINGTIDVGAETNSPYAVVITATDDEDDTSTSEFNWIIGAPLSLPLCINSGDQGPITAFGKSFIADQYVTPAEENFYNTPAGQAIIGTTSGSGEEDLFQSEHWTAAAGGLQYNIPTGNGDFTVDLYMAELFANANDARVLNITIEGIEVLTGLDLFEDYGKFTAATLTFSTTVTDAFLDIVITSTADNPKLNGLCVSVAPPNTPPTVAITGPANINVSRGTNVSFIGEAIDAKDGDISATINWSSDDNETVFSSGTIGAVVDASFVRPGSTIVTASVTDSEGLPGSDTFTVNVSAPEVTFAAPTESEVLNSLTVNVTANPLGVLFGNAEHFHVYINPPNINAIDTETRISTAPSAPWKIDDTNFVFDETSGALSKNGLGNGIQEGVNTLIIRVADQFHNEFTNPPAQAIVNFTVTLPDTTDPIALCQNITVELDATGNASITAADVDGGSSDNDGIASLAIDVNSFTVADLGTNLVTLTVTDINNNTATCTANVTIEDNLTPTAVCTDFTLQLDANGTGSLTTADVDGGSTDNVAIVNTDIDISDFDTSDVGLNTVILTVTDSSGNSSTCTAVVTVEDNVAPTAICQNINVELDSNGQATITPADIDNGSDDAAGIVDLFLSTSDFDCNDVGDNTVTLTITDTNGNVATCTTTVTVIDGTPPVVACATDIFITSASYQVVMLTPPTASDACGVKTVVGSRSDGLLLTDPYPLGITTVLWTVTDNNNLEGTCQQQVIITAPVSSGKEILGFDITEQVSNESINSGTGTIALTVSTGTLVTALAPTIVISNAAEISPSSGTPRDFTTPQTYTVTAEDDTTKEWTVTISVAPDTEDPVITSCPDDIIVANDAGVCGALVTFNAIATDNLPGVTISYSVASGSMFDVGTTTVSVTATDAAGLTATCSFDVTVNDLEAPEITCPVDGTVQGDLAGNAILPDFTGLAVVSDNCDSSVMITQSPAPGTNVSGTVPVTLTATDIDLNSVPCTFNVIIVPATLASLTIAPSAISVNLFQGQTAMVNYVVDSDDASTIPTPAAMSIIDNVTSNTATWVSTTSAADQGTSYEVNLDATGLTPGTHNATLTAGPVSGYTNASIPITLIVEAVPTVLSVTSFTLVNADNEQDIMTITNGMIIDVTTLPTLNLNIRANSTSDVKSVRMQLTGTLAKTATENFAPYALYGDSSGNYAAQAFVIGNYNLTANPYSGSSLGGTPGIALTVNFELTDKDPVCASFNASLSGITNPSTCLGVGSATAVPLGGVSPFTYQWDNGETTATANNLLVGPHSVIVRDVNGCSKTLTFTLTGPPLPAVTLTPFASVLNTAPAFTLTGGSPAGGTYSGTGVTGTAFNPVIGVGTYAITYSYTDTNGCSNSATRSITVTTETSNAALLVLDATDDTVLFALTDGLQINKATIGNTPLGIIFNTSLNPAGVQFTLTGPINENRYEGPAPHSLFGDIGVDILGKPFPVGNYTLVADPNLGPPQIINFSIIDGPPVNQSPVVAKTLVNEMSIAPNPAHEQVTMSFEEHILIEEILIFDVTGRLIKTIKEPFGLDSRTIDFNVYDLPIGTYFIKTVDSKGIQYQQQMLIDRY
ncbi:malectin domain-containing carbohydrate-binding protein [Maribacter sp. ACAM166]|uniref:malectin domain-containing carbohydrate-binding protein n=1 Tax=Maribacter sp. ACAM166 TaxID=2508996 RepID=UPI0014853D05|nr:malectin domain-containing carbohydrate-binding protein [Maribacter sp. ACAM166]